MRIFNILKTLVVCISLHGSPKYGLTLGLTRKFIPPPWYKRGVDGTPPRVFDMLHYFEMILPLVESLLIYFRGGGASGGL